MHKFADVDTFLRLASHALTTTVDAARTGDAAAAQEVLDAAPHHRAAAKLARRSLGSRAWVPAPQVAGEVRVVDDVEAVLDVLRLIAARVVEAPATPVDVRRERQLRRLREAGERRLRHIQDGCVFAAAEAGCTATLLDTADQGAAAADEQGRLLGRLAATLLDASRHAAAAA